jgi:hypothetical protein
MINAAFQVEFFYRTPLRVPRFTLCKCLLHFLKSSVILPVALWGRFLLILNALNKVPYFCVHEI